MKIVKILRALPHSVFLGYFWDIKGALDFLIPLNNNRSSQFNESVLNHSNKEKIISMSYVLSKSPFSEMISDLISLFSFFQL